MNLTLGLLGPDNHPPWADYWDLGVSSPKAGCTLSSVSVWGHDWHPVDGGDRALPRAAPQPCCCLPPLLGIPQSLGAPRMDMGTQGHGDRALLPFLTTPKPKAGSDTPHQPCTLLSSTTQIP